MSETKDYSLLRPFDLESASIGDKFLWINLECEFLGVSKHASASGNNYLRAEHYQGLSYVIPSEARAIPLAWVEGRPVYRGDVLYESHYGRIVATGSRCDGILNATGPEAGLDLDVRDCTWTPPKVKREGFVCITKTESRSTICGEIAGAIVRNGMIFPTEDDAQKWVDRCGGGVIDIVPIEWDEPAC